MSEILWNLENVCVAGPDRRRLDDVSIEITAGITAILGPSGSGKTTLLNLLVDFLKPSTGTVAARLPQENGRLPLFWVPQNDGLWPHLVVREHLRAVMAEDDTQDEQIQLLLDQFDLLDTMDQCPGQLSQGERARLSVVRSLVSGASVLVMDEPLVHVDPARRDDYSQIVQETCRATRTSLVFATHSPESVLADASSAVCLEDGRLLCHGPVDELYYRPPTEELARFMGPANWLPEAELEPWMSDRRNGHAKPPTCLRPEQLAIDHCEDSPLVVESSRFAGTVAEVVVRHEPSSQKRRFFHRPAGDALRCGDHVVIRMLLLLSCLFFCGCGDAATAELPVSECRYFNLPVAGPMIPAPRSMTVGPDDSLYVLDDAARVLVYDEAGELLRQWSMPDSEVGNPEGVCILKDGRVAVADTHYHRVVFFDQTGELLDMFGSLGNEPGQFHYPVAITQDQGENIYVCEYGSGDRVQKFSPDGTFLLQFGSFGTETGQFQRPSGIAWHDGKLYVADAFNERIQVFSERGDFLAFLGSHSSDASLHYPYDLSFSADGRLFVVEYAGRVTALDILGNVLGRFGSSGRGQREFANPWGIAVASNGNVFVADTGNRRVAELRP